MRTRSSCASSPARSPPMRSGRMRRRRRAPAQARRPLAARPVVSDRSRKHRARRALPCPGSCATPTHPSPPSRPRCGTCPAEPTRARRPPSKREPRRSTPEGLAALTYTREAVCASRSGGVRPGGRAGRVPGATGTVAPTPSGPSSAAGSAQVGDARLHRSGCTAGIYDSILDRAYDAGYDGWMEDYGEYAPPDSIAEQRHDRRPECTTATRSSTTERAGATRSPRTDPSSASTAQGSPAPRGTRRSSGAATRRTGWGFDGLQFGRAGGADDGALRRLALGIRHRRLLHPLGPASDTGAARSLDRVRSLLRRDADEGRRDRGGRESSRPQVWEQPTAADLAALRQAPHPALPVPDRGPTTPTERSGMPIMRQLALAYPRRPSSHRPRRRVHVRPRSARRPGARAGRGTAGALYLPGGRWVSFWDAISYRERGRVLPAGPSTAGCGGRRRITVDAPLERGAADGARGDPAAAARRPMSRRSPPTPIAVISDSRIAASAST